MTSCCVMSSDTAPVGTMIIKQDERFTRLVALREAPPAKSGNRQWHFKCDCGKETIARVIDVQRGFKRSCGCLMRETSAANGKLSSMCLIERGQHFRLAADSIQKQKGITWSPTAAAPRT